MITVNIGRIFLAAYNSKYKKNLSAKDFFEKEYFELFFNHKKYLVWPQNSPFVQGVSSSKNGEYGIGETIKDQDGNTLKFDTSKSLEKYLEENVHSRNDILELKNASLKGVKILKTLNEYERNVMLEAFHDKVDDSLAANDIDASIAIGYQASEVKEYATTSGLVSDIDIKTEKDEVYLSWIGSGLSVGVSGGLSILFDMKEILLKVYDGWKVYRNFLNDPTLQRLAGNKITSWNGQWLSYAFSGDYRENFDFASLDNVGFFKVEKAATIIETVKWSRLFFNLSSQFPNQTCMGYVFSFGQMNKTLGFYPFKLQHARKLVMYYKTLFGDSPALRDTKYYENMFGIHIKRACELGAIGIQALEPEGLRKYFDKDKMPNLKKSSISQKKGQSNEEFAAIEQETENKDYENKVIPFRTYKTWLLAMITKNKEEMSDYTQSIAKAIYVYRVGDKKGSTKKANITKNLLSSKSKKYFLDVLSDIIPDVDQENLQVFKELRDRVHLMNNEDFGYFVVLLKFDYAYQERIS